MKSSAEVRELFLRYFEEHGHRRVASHSLIPPADPTLLFVNAGMVQFKDVFVGVRQVDYRRATSSQKCLRVSGKHNDLENVGRTARHHTFFEMLGNFSFGDYFKKDAIRFGYEFLVDRMGLDPARMYYTVFGGDEADGLAPDTEAEQLWMDTARVGRDRLLRFGKKDNFWAMGETGPCGPCSEILYDRGPGPWACGKPECGPGCDCDRFTEVWNLVFMQYERKTGGGPLGRLPAPSIDTGMGLERLTAVVQGKGSNYETDAFMPLIERTCELFREETGKPVTYGPDEETNVALRVIADHARAAAFLVGDGVYPDNEGRGYITRLLVRRAVRFGRKMGFARPFFVRVCDRVVDLMVSAYPELDGRRGLIEKVISAEEQGFLEAFEEGRRSLEQQMEKLRGEGRKQIPGDFLFWLHDERGFQPDLTGLIAGENGFSVDRAGYDRLMEEKRLASGRKETAGEDAAAVLQRALLEKAGPTRFTGYDAQTDRARVMALAVDGRLADRAAVGADALVALDRTPFYGEAGGQVGDTGTLAAVGGKARVLNTVKTAGDLHVHTVRVEAGALAVGDEVEAEVDAGRRAGIRAHHSATHLLHWALGEVLGPHIKQEGSHVRDDLLRFDFRHFSPITREEVDRIESLVAQEVLDNSAVETRVLPLAEAVATGAKAFFDEKYGEDVRLVSMAAGTSRELCGGTHARRTGDIGLVKIVKQEAVSSGVRRVYAVCHAAAARRMQDRERKLEDAAALMKCAPDEVVGRVDRVLEQVSKLEKEIKELNRKVLEAGAAGGPGVEVEEIGPFKAAHAFLGVADTAAVSGLADMVREKHQANVALVGAADAGKLIFVIAGNKDRGGRFHCGKATTDIAKLTGGRGGGKPDFGQAGSGDPNLWKQAVARFRDLLTESA